MNRLKFIYVSVACESEENINRKSTELINQGYLLVGQAGSDFCLSLKFEDATGDNKDDVLKRSEEWKQQVAEHWAMLNSLNIFKK
jgi:hypothetical protein